MPPILNTDRATVLAVINRVRSQVRVPLRVLFADISRFLNSEVVVTEILESGTVPRSIVRQVLARTEAVERDLTLRMARAVTRVAPGVDPGAVAAIAAEQAQILTQRLITQQEAVLARLGPLVARSGDPEAVRALAQLANLPERQAVALATRMADRLEADKPIRGLIRQASGRVTRRAGLIAQDESVGAVNATIEQSARGVPAVGKRILKQSVSRRDGRVDEVCAMADNGDKIGIDQPFANGLGRPPFHVGCRCSLRLWEVNVETGVAV